MTLVEFLLARIADDEQRARCAGHGCGYLHEHNCGWVEVDFPQAHNTCAYYKQRFIRHHSPARVLADCAAKRQIIGNAATIIRDEGCSACGGVGPEWPVLHEDYCGGDRQLMMAETTLLYLASVYAAHPDYRQEWRP